MRYLHSAGLLIVLACLTSSCMLFGINIKGKTPKRAGKYPKFTEADSLLGTLNPNRTAYDVHYYKLALEPNLKGETLAGNVEIHFTATRDGVRVLQLDAEKTLSLDAITLDGEPVKGIERSRKHRAAIITLPKTLNKGQQGVLSVAYHGQPEEAKRPPWKGGMVWEKDEEGRPWVGVACEMSGASIWWPCKDHFSDEPDSVSIELTVPEGLVGVANGQLRNHEQLEGKERYSWHVSYSINLYNITFYIGNFDHFTIPYRKGDINYDLDFYVLDYNFDMAVPHFERTPQVIETFEELFGEYPWWEDGYKIVESPYEGMEHQTAIAYGNGFNTSYMGISDYDYILVHETAHEWWGNSVTSSEMADIWLHEGFASYAEVLYLEATRGKATAERLLSRYRLFISNKRPLIWPRGVRYYDVKDSDIYMKGAWFLHTLRTVIDDDKVFSDILHSFAVNNRESLVTTQDFLDLVNEKTGQDHSLLFEQYVFQRKAPNLVFEVLESREGTVLRYKWENLVEGLQLPAYFYVNGERRQVWPSSTYTEEELPSDAKVGVENDYVYHGIERLDD